MPELPEVETLRRQLETCVLGRTVGVVRRSRALLRGAAAGNLSRALRGRTLERLDRRGKYLLFGFDGGVTLLSHLGMSGRWIFHAGRPKGDAPHVHARIGFRDGAWLLYEDPRRFGQLRVVPTERLADDPSLAVLGVDPFVAPPGADRLAALSRGLSLSVKAFLMDQRRLAGIGNIYASEILFRARVDPRRLAGRLTRPEWEAVAAEIPAVLGEAVSRMGTTFSMYRTVWNETGQYGEQLLVYDRGGEPCRRCGSPVRRIVQGGRATYYCPGCQRGGSRRAGGRTLGRG